MWLCVAKGDEALFPADGSVLEGWLPLLLVLLLAAVWVLVAGVYLRWTRGKGWKGPLTSCHI